MQLIEPTCPLGLSARTSLPVASQTFTDPSAMPEDNSSPWGLKATHVTAPVYTSSNVVSLLVDDISHTFTSRSRLRVANRLPSGLKHKSETVPALWLIRVCSAR